MSSKGKSSASSSSKTGSLGSDQKYAEKLAKDKQETWEWAGKVVNASKKSEKRILLVGQNRVYFLTTSKGKLANSGHYLELTMIKSSKPDQVELTFESFKYNLVSSEADEIIHQIRICYHAVFGRLPAALQPKVDVSPTNRLRDLPEARSLACGGYAEAYISVCDYLSVQLRPDIVWDIRNVLGSNNVTEFNIKEFEQPLRPEDQKALMTSLAYNSHFRTFTCKRFKLSRDSFTSLAKCFEHNTSIESLELKGVGMSKDAFIPVCDAIAKNPGSGLTTIQIPENSVSDNTLVSLGTAIASLKAGLVVLDVSKNNTKTGVASLMQGVRKNMHMPATLARLNISHNVLGSSGSSALAQWLANPNGLQVLQLSHTSANLDTVIAAVQRGCQELQRLDVSGNKISKKESGTLTRFLQGAGKLKELDISETGIPPSGIKEVVDALSANYYLQDFSLVCQKNKFGPGGASQIAQVFVTSKNIARVDLGNNDFGDEGIERLCKQLQKNEALKHLGLGGNFSEKSNSKNREDALEAIIELITSECPIESLDISGGSRNALGGAISTFLYALGTDDSLKSLDVSGNKMGDKGALALSKALQTNRTLTALYLDDNGIGFPGFQSLSYGMKRNTTLKNMPLPISDITSAMPKDQDGREAFQTIVRTIDSFVRRNQSPQSKFSAQQGAGGINAANMLITMGEREELERLRFKIKATGRKLDNEDTLIMEDAENNDNYIQSIHSIQETHHMAVTDDVVQALRSFVPQLVPVVEKHQNALLTEMMDFVSKRYQSIDKDTVGRLQRNIQFMGKTMDLDAVEKVIVDAAGDEIKNKVQECFLSAVEITVDYIYEKIGDMLQNVLDDVKTGAGGDDTDSSEYEYEEIVVTDSDDSGDDDDGEYYDDSASSSSAASSSNAVPPADPLLAATPPPVAQRKVPPPGGAPPGIGGTPPPVAARPSRPVRPPSTNGAPPVAARPDRPGRPVRPPSSGGGPVAVPPRSGAMAPRGRGRGRGRGSTGPAVGGGIAARLQAMGGGIPMGGMMGGGPPMRTSAPKPAQAAVIKGSQNSASAPVPRSAPPRVAGKKAAGGGGGGLFSKKKKKTKIIRRKVKKKGGVRASNNLASNIKVAKPSGDKSNIAKIETKESNITNHMTRARPMMQRKRRPPTRRPRNLAA